MSGRGWHHSSSWERHRLENNPNAQEGIPTRSHDDNRETSRRDARARMLGGRCSVSAYISGANAPLRKKTFSHEVTGHTEKSPAEAKGRGGEAEGGISAREWARMSANGEEIQKLHLPWFLFAQIRVHSRAPIVPLGRGRSPRCPKIQARRAVSRRMVRLARIEPTRWGGRPHSLRGVADEDVGAPGVVFIRGDSRHSRARSALPLIWVVSAKQPYHFFAGSRWVAEFQPANLANPRE